MEGRHQVLIVAFWVCVAFMLSGSTSFVHAQSAVKKAPAGTEANKSAELQKNNDKTKRYVSIDFNDVDISVFIKFISELTGRNFIVDPRVKGKITIISPSKISVNEAYKVFESVLDVHGFAAVQAGDVTKIIPSPYARTMDIETLYKSEKKSPEDKIVTQLVHLKYADPNEVKQLIAPLVSRSSVVLAYQPTNMLIITDVYSNVQRLLGIIKAIDVSGIGRQVQVIPLQHASADDMAKIITSTFTAQNRGRKPDQQDITIVPDSRNNALVVMASEVNTDRIKKLVELLDKPMPRGKDNIHVYYLENANAEDLVKVLQALPTKGEAQKGRAEAPVVSENVKIAADKATNSLIIQASKDDYETLRGVIKKLDVARPMVYIECLIMEVNMDKSFNLGAEWMVGNNASYKGRSGIVGGGFSGGAEGGDPGYSYISPATSLASALSGSSSTSAISSLTSSSSSMLPPGFSMGVFGENITVGNLSFPTIAAVIQAYKKDEDVHILSTPQILTTDNEEAKITVGKNIPYLTNSSGGNYQYSNYEYKDVGITLEITPQINKDRKIRLKISQEVTKLASTTTQLQPTTLKRAIKTTVVVNDNHTVVIGGLIDNSFSATKYQVPCLGSIPVIGYLFRSLGRENTKTNLFVFLTPRVIQGSGEASALYKDKKKQIDTIRENSPIKLYGSPDKEN